MNRLFTAINLAYLALSVPLVLSLFVLSGVALALGERPRPSAAPPRSHAA